MTAVRNLLDTLRDQGLWVLVTLLLIGGALWGFAELADEVKDGETHAFDRAVMLALRETENHADPLGPEWVELAARDGTPLAVMQSAYADVDGARVLLRPLTIAAP